MEGHDKFGRANLRAKKLELSMPRAISARYDQRTGRVVIQLSSKLDVAFDPHDAEGLEDARPEQLKLIEISPSGFGLHFPKLDADLYVPALIDGFFGSRKWMASRLGSAGGRARSVAKTAASQKNGLLGGRPKKSTAPVLKVAARRARPAKQPTSVKR